MHRSEFKLNFLFFFLLTAIKYHKTYEYMSIYVPNNANAINYLKVYGKWTVFLTTIGNRLMTDRLLLYAKNN